MTPGEIISASIAGVALIIAWLARLDSMKAASAAQKSADAAHKANELLARQLGLATDEQKRQLEKEQSDSLPIIDWKGGGHYSPLSGTSGWHFRNLGGAVTNLKIETENKEILAMINPTNIRNTLLNNEEGDAIFEFKKGLNPLSSPFVFNLSCKTRRGDQWQKRFKLDVKDRGPIGVVEA
jgi:hypothetical protein